MINITRHLIKNEKLTPWVKFIWQIDQEQADFQYKLLPTECIDVILNLADPMYYTVHDKEITATSLHINGLRNTHSLIRQQGSVHIFGISFYPYGLYPFVHKPMTDLKDHIIDLTEFAPKMAQKLEQAVHKITNEEIITDIEAILLSELDVDQTLIENAQIIYELLTNEEHPSIKTFCQQNALNIKTLERMTLRYTGFTPKTLQNISRFQSVGNQLTHIATDRLTDVAYDNHFTDQAHLVKEFKRFSGVAPKSFLSEKVSVKEHASYTYL